MDQFIVPAITWVLVTLLLSYLNKSAKAIITPTLNGYFRLRLHKFYWYIGVGSISIGLVAFIAAGLTIKDANGWVIGSAFLILFGGLGFICTIWYVNHSVNFNSNRIEVVSVYKKKTSINWSDITSIKFNALAGLLVFTNTSGQKIKVHQHIVGLHELLQMIETKTNWKAKDLKLPFKNPKH